MQPDLLSVLSCNSKATYDMLLYGQCVYASCTWQTAPPPQILILPNQGASKDKDAEKEL